MVVSSHLQEVIIMNSHIFDPIANERTMEITRSIELFVGLLVVISMVGFVCLAVA